MKIFIALVGKSPAVLTTTLNAIKDEGRWVPDQIKVITTKVGENLLRERLMTPIGARGEKRFDFADKMGWPKTLFETFEENPQGGLSILVPQAEGEEGDEDSHEADELDRMGSLIYRTLSDATKSENNEVCLSLSGGRKTMSHLAGTAMALLARPGKDRLVHTLIKPEALENTDFLYQGSNKSGQYTDAFNKAHEEPAELRLSNVPFLRLRGSEGIGQITRNMGLADTVASINWARHPGETFRLIYKKSSGNFWLGDTELKPDPKSFPALQGPALIRLLGSLKSAGPTPYLTFPFLGETVHKFMSVWKEQLYVKANPRIQDIDDYVAKFEACYGTGLVHKSTLRDYKFSPLPKLLNEYTCPIGIKAVTSWVSAFNNAIKQALPFKSDDRVALVVSGATGTSTYFLGDALQYEEIE